jgi:glycosyltransferase involved in cell wall biosynthesis
MKVLWLTPYPVETLQPEVTFLREQRSHAASWVVTLSDELARGGKIDLHIATACAGIREDQHVAKHGISYHLLRHVVPFTVRGFPPYFRLDVVTKYASLRRSVAKLLKTVEPEIVHVHGTEYGYGLAALESDVPAVVSIQGIISRIKQIEDNTFYRLQAPIERDVISRAKYFGSRTEWASEFISGLNPSATVYRMDEAVSPAFFEKRERTNSSNILFVGSLMKRKGIEDAIEAMALVVKAIPTATLSVVGGGKESYLQLLQQKADGLGISKNVLWLGGKTAKDVADLHARSCLLVHPSLIDNSPNTVAEAMVAGLPVVATRVGGVPSMIANEETGILIESHRPEELAEAILRILTDDGLRGRLSTKAKEVAYGRHFPSAVAQQTLSVYNDVLTKQKPS